MTRLLSLIVVGLFFVGCQSKPVSPATESSSATPAKEETTRPSIGTAKARQDCLYYTSTSNGKMAIGGSIKMGSTLRVLERSNDGWTQVRLNDGREASVPTEDLTTLKQYQFARSRARAAKRGKFKDPRPKIIMSRSGRPRTKLPTAPPPPDFVPPPLPDTPLDDPLSNVPDILLQGNEKAED